MDIDRRRGDCGQNAREWTTFCLDQLEAAPEFENGLGWHTEVVPGLVLEELIGAVVASEEFLDDYAEEDECDDCE